jgi:predicted kinase
VRHLVPSPATDRLDWLLDGLNGDAGWGGDAAEVLAPQFAALIPPEDFAARVRQRAAALAPVTVTGVQTGDCTARADIRDRNGVPQVVTCTVEELAPHRITATRTVPLIPAYLTPRLPADFTGYQELAGCGAGASLIVVCGLPGTGKSTLADALGRALGVPVFAGDWMMGALTPFGGYLWDKAMESGAEQLTTLAVRQLRLGQSAILDFPAEDPADRTRWRTLAAAAGASFRVVLCVCSDPRLHQARLEGRQRGIPGWHDAGHWPNVQRRLAVFQPWTDEDRVLTVDGVRPAAENLAAALEYVRALPEQGYW